MKAFWIAYFAGCTFTLQAAQNDYYSCFTNSIGTPSGIVQIKDPSLLDTNNTGLKLTNALLDLENFCRTGEISDLRVGMTMDQTIAVWGKPKAAFNRCVMALATFWYNDVALAFEGNELEAVRIDSRATFLKGLSTSSAPADFVRVFGSPTRQLEKEGVVRSLDYVGAKGSVRFYFWDDQVSCVELVRTAKRLEPRKQLDAQK
jgi:hypothetical protein